MTGWLTVTYLMVDCGAQDHFPHWGKYFWRPAVIWLHGDGHIVDSRKSKANPDGSSGEKTADHVFFISDFITKM